MQRAARAAAADATILICGESGTGKELVARALHRASGRAQSPFVAVNCAAVPGSLLESELFGHVRGAFTGATDHHPGVFLEAGHGTVLLDEVGEMPLELQPRLLRALQDHRVRPIGGTGDRPFAARLIAATNSDLEVAVREHRFRADLFYRLDVVRLEVPPLRERRDEILPLAEHFLSRAAQRCGRTLTLTDGARERLTAWQWPGNVRELENCMECAALTSEREEVCEEQLPRRIREALDTEGSGSLRLDELMRHHVQRTLRAFGGNKTRAAEALGVDRRTLHRMLARDAHGRH
ncbi:MAG: sigma 54-interacting transcriptional regulator [Archangium sp.]|nr:sigma 54-interacting transcriptional regulator [Archangium sp.]